MRSAAAEINRLTLRIPSRGSWVHAATDVDLSIRPGTVTVLAGESGSGKTMLTSAVCGLLPKGTRATGSIRIGGTEMLGASQKQWRRVRGSVVGLASQSGATAFTPVRAVGRQLEETIAARGVSQDPSSLLAQVGLDPATAELFPHELSGGMAQRLAVAAALVGRPPILLADEPTAGLDPDLTQQIFSLLKAIADEGTATLIVTHDLQAVEDSGVADTLAIMYAGRIVESGPVARVLHRPEHDYTAALLGALPSRGLQPIPGMPPELTDLDPGYEFKDRLLTSTGTPCR